jgi:hypothetical protein
MWATNTWAAAFGSVGFVMLSSSTLNWVCTETATGVMGNVHRWDLANMEEGIQMGVEMGIDAIISRPTRVQQLRDTLSDLGVNSELLEKSPRALTRCWQSPLILARYQ